jgi:NitT/TauT family transport system permease protein
MIVLQLASLTSDFMPGTIAIIETFFNLITNPTFLYNVGVSLARLSSGWIIGMILGTLFGILIGVNERFRAYVLPVISAIFPIPKIALLPLFLIFFGLGETSKVITIFIGSFFPSIITVYSAVQRTPNQLITLATSFGYNEKDIIRKVIIPYSLPTIIQGFRTSTSMALTLLVAAEMLGAQVGLGYWIFNSGSTLDFAEMIACLITLSIIGLIIAFCISILLKKFCTWSLESEGKGRQIG